MTAICALLGGACFLLLVALAYGLLVKRGCHGGNADNRYGR